MTFGNGASSVYGSGMLGLGMSFSMEELVIDNDMIGMMRYVAKGIEVNDCTLSLDAIREVGIANNFIGRVETMNNMDLVSQPLTLDRTMYDEWVGKGAKTDVDIAHERVIDILTNYEPTPIEFPDLVAAVIKKADDRHNGKE